MSSIADAAGARAAGLGTVFNGSGFISAVGKQHLASYAKAYNATEVVLVARQKGEP